MNEFNPDFPEFQDAEEIELDKILRRFRSDVEHRVAAINVEERLEQVLATRDHSRLRPVSSAPDASATTANDALSPTITSAAVGVVLDDLRVALGAFPNAEAPLFLTHLPNVASYVLAAKHALANLLDGLSTRSLTRESAESLTRLAVHNTREAKTLASAVAEHANRKGVRRDIRAVAIQLRTVEELITNLRVAVVRLFDDADDTSPVGVSI